MKSSDLTQKLKKNQFNPWTTVCLFFAFLKDSFDHSSNAFRAIMKKKFDNISSGKKSIPKNEFVIWYETLTGDIIWSDDNLVSVVEFGDCAFTFKSCLVARKSVLGMTTVETIFGRSDNRCSCASSCIYFVVLFEISPTSKSCDFIISQRFRKLKKYWRFGFNCRS